MAAARGDPPPDHTRRSGPAPHFAPTAVSAASSTGHLPPQHLFTDDELRAIDVPTRLVFAERSNIHRSHQVAARVEPLSPHVHAEVVPDTTHLLTLQKPDLVTARILDLVEGI